MKPSKPRLPEQIAFVRSAAAFDADWYASTFGDVALLGMEPAEHFARFGPLLRRAPNPEFPAGFFLDVSTSGDRTASRMLQMADEGLPDDVPLPLIMWAIERARLAYGPAIARRTAVRHLPPGQGHLVDVLDAAAAAQTGRHADWAVAMSGYLSHFDLAPIFLDPSASEETGNLLAHVRAPVPEKIRGGPKVTVLMSVYNAQDTVGYAVRSVLGQSWTELELLVVDDASDDRSVEVVERVAAGDPRCTILRNPVNVGPYGNRNAALQHATGDYVTCHDADDWAHPSRIARQVAFTDEKGLGHSMAGMLRVTPGGMVTRFTKGGPNTEDGTTIGAFSSVMLDRRLLLGIYGHWDDVRFGADSEMLHRIESIESRPIPRLIQPLLLGLDAPGSLTNDLHHGHRSGAIAPSRRENRAASDRWHRTGAAADPWLPFPHEPRRFPVHPVSQNAEGASATVKAAHRPKRGRPVERCDLAIVTNLRFPGGNCSSTLDEARMARDAGLDVRVIHCPALVPTDIRAFEHAARYDAIRELIRDGYRLGGIEARRVVVRHPRVATSPAFSRFVPGLRAERVDIVINNALHRPNGDPVYDVDALVDAARRIDAPDVRIAPLSPVIRRELAPLLPPDLLAPEDWPPTFDVEAYALEPKETLAAPFHVGRHGRDGREKWLSDPETLRAAYPDHPDFRIRVLGGADKAAKVLGGLPTNWRVEPFGAVSPRDYLAALDVFAYYPDEALVEAFGRTVIEAMIAARPVVLPPRFRETFGDLAHYAEPHEVADAVRGLARDWPAERRRLLAVREEAVARFSSAALARRFPEFDLSAATGTAG